MKAPCTVICFFFICLSFSAFAQKSDNLPVDRPDQVEITVIQGLLINSPQQEGIPLNAGGSGTISLGTSFKLHLAQNKMGFRIQPSVSWTRFSYEQAESKIFPSPYVESNDFQVQVEKHRLFFIDVPLGLFVNILKDEDDDPRFFLEAGGFAGYKLRSVYKTRVENNLTEQETKQLVRSVYDLENWRYGLYARLGIRWLAIHFTYRLSDVFKANPRNADGSPSAFEMIDLPPMELGLAFFL